VLHSYNKKMRQKRKSRNW